MPRKATWLVIIWTALMALWAASVPDSVGQVCTNVSSSSRSACEVGATLGGGVGLVVIFIVWLVGFLVTGMIWLMTRPQRRLCPACGTPAKKGQFTCSRCGFDFRAAATANAAMPTQQAGPPPGWGQPPRGPG